MAERVALRSEVYEFVTDGLGGSWSAEHGVGPLNAEQWLRSTAAPTRQLLAAAKRVVDPQGILGHPQLPF